MIIGNTANERQESVEVNEGTNDRNFTVGTSNVSSLINENVLNVKTLERCFNERIDREMCNIVDTVEDRIQNTILTAIDNIVAPKIELAIRSINASSARDVASASGNSERREYEGTNASFENASENNRALGTTHINDETRCNSHDGVSELLDLEHSLTDNHPLITCRQGVVARVITAVNNFALRCQSKNSLTIARSGNRKQYHCTL